MVRLLSIPICLMMLSAVVVADDVRTLIDPCTSGSYFFKQEGVWHLHVKETGRTKKILDSKAWGASGPHFGFAPPMEGFTIRTETLDHYKGFVGKPLLPLRYIPQIRGDCPLSEEVQPIYKLMAAFAALDTMESLCDSKLVIKWIEKDWRVTCDGCAAARLEHLMPPPEAYTAKKKISIISRNNDDAKTLSWTMMIGECREERE